MPRALTIFGMVVAGIVALAFGLDLVLGFPFYQAHRPMDVCFVLGAAILAYLSWITLREQR